MLVLNAQTIPAKLRLTSSTVHIRTATYFVDERPALGARLFVENVGEGLTRILEIFPEGSFPEVGQNLVTPQ